MQLRYRETNFRQTNTNQLDRNPAQSTASCDHSRQGALPRAETIRRVAEAAGNGATAVVEFQRDQERNRRIQAREGLKIGGLINIGVGLGLIFFLSHLINRRIGLCGLIPGLIGVAMLIYVYLLAAPIE